MILHYGKRIGFVLWVLSLLLISAACSKESLAALPSNAPGTSPTKVSESAAPETEPIESSPTGSELPSATPSLTTEEPSASPVTFEGVRNRTDVSHAMPAGLRIFDQTNETFEFELNASWFAHSGIVEGTALLLSERTAEYVIEPNEYSDGGTISFSLGEDSGIDVFYEGDEGSLGVGANVSVDGLYILGEPRLSSPPSAEELVGKDMLSRIAELVGDEVLEELVFVMENGQSYQDEAMTYSGFFPGIGTGADLLVTDDGYIYCLAYYAGQEGYVFYSNDKAYQDKLHPLFELRFPDEELSFVFKEV